MNNLNNWVCFARISKLAIITNIAVILIITLGNRRNIPILEPIKPPKVTARTRLSVRNKFIAGIPFEACPNNPEILFTRIKTAEHPAIAFGWSHFMKFKTGDRNIPPPIPTNPDNKPMSPPIMPDVTFVVR